MIITGTNSDTRQTPTIYDAPGASEFELLNYDHRGMGQSSSPDTPPTMEDYADDIAKLLDQLGWESTAVVAVSFGGMVAQHFALRHPDRVTRLTLCCTSPGGDGGSSYPLHELTDLTAEEYARFIMTKMNLQHTPEWQAEHPEKAEKVFQYYYRGARPNYEDPIKHQAMINQFAARSKHDVHQQIHHLTMPTLIACGKDDGVAPLSNSEFLSEAIPNSELKVFEGGHLFMKENSKAWPYMFSFLKGN